MCRIHNARGVMDVQANVSLFSRLQLAGMDSHAHTDDRSIRPGCILQRSLSGDSGRNRVSSSLKDHKESVALGIDLVTIPLLKRRTQQAPALSQHFGIAATELL
jgi:hypothetical protein